MDIFESLENLNISEECFNDILNLVEEYISEVKANTLRRAIGNNYEDRMNRYHQTMKDYNKSKEELEKFQNNSNGGYIDGDWDSPEEEKEWNELYNKKKEAAKKYAEADRKFHNVNDLKRANIPDSDKVQANTLFNNAKKVWPSVKKKAEEHAKQEVSNGRTLKDIENDKTIKDYAVVKKLMLADPVKSRKAEEFED